MNILIYIPKLTQESGGTRQYALALVKTLVRDIENKYFLLHNNDDQELIRIVNSSSRTNLIIIDKKVGTERKIESILLNVCKLLNFILIRLQINYRVNYFSYLNRITKKFNIDLVHSPFQYTPYTNVKTICTLHDVQELHFPEYFTPFDRFVRAFNYMDSIERASHVVVSYKHIKEDLIKYFRVKKDKISVVLLDFNEFWFNQFLEISNKITLALPPTIPEKYILYPANTWPHKNHINLLYALSILKDEKINLVCTGSLNNYYNDYIFPLISELKLEENVHFIGIQDEKTLFSLYKNACFIIIPTIYEAGSFPLVESIILECPVVCSNVTSLPETIGNNKFTFNPSDILQISSVINNMFYDEKLRNESKLNSISRKTKLLESQCLGNIIEIYKKINE